MFTQLSLLRSNSFSNDLYCFSLKLFPSFSLNYSIESLLSLLISKQSKARSMFYSLMAKSMLEAASRNQEKSMKPELSRSTLSKICLAISLASLKFTFKYFCKPLDNSSKLNFPSPLRSSDLKESNSQDSFSERLTKLTMKRSTPFCMLADLTYLNFFRFNKALVTKLPSLFSFSFYFKYYLNQSSWMTSSIERRF